MGSLIHRRASKFRFRTASLAIDLVPGSSIAVNGCCLTVTELGPDWWESDVVDETLSRTTMGSLQPDDFVNLERSLVVGGRLDGHIVTGHIDATGVVLTPAPDLRIQVPPAHLGHVVEKGSIAIDGVSLTVVGVSDQGVLEVAVVPHTAQVTTLGRRGAGQPVNLEFDILAKYVQRLLALGPG